MPNMTERDLKSYDRRIQRLLRAMETFEALEVTPQQPHQDLVMLVKKIAHFNQSTPFRELLAPLSNLEMPETSRERLLGCLHKVARYREIAKFLCREAETVPMLRNATIKSLKLPAQVFNRETDIEYNGNVASILERLSAEENATGQYALPLWLQNIVAATPDAKFASEIKQTLRESKIHAEIQILTHYEGAVPTVLRPRVIASNKDACYLCHAFMRIHGQYCVPKTHGKLYRGWRLPAERIPNSLQQRLNEFLEQQVRGTVRRAREAGSLTSPRPPNESTLFPLPVSASLLSGMTMTNLSIVSNHSRLDLTTTTTTTAIITAPAAQDPSSQPTFQALGTRISGVVPLRPFGAADTADAGDPGPCVVERGGSDDEQDSQKGVGGAASSVAFDTAQKGKGVATASDQAPGLVDPITESHVHFLDDAPASSASPSDRETTGQESAGSDDESARSASSSRDSVVDLGGDATIVFEPAGRAHGTGWFRYKKLDLFMDESSGRFTHQRLSTSEAEKALESNVGLLCDVRALAVGAEIYLPKDRRGNAYFKCGDEAVRIGTRQ